MTDNDDRFVLAGLLERVDVDERRLRIGGRDVWVSDHVGLDGLRAGTRVVVSGRREPATGRPHAERVFLPVGPPPAGPLAERADAAPGGVDASRILQLVVSMLVELRLEAQVLECALLPTNDLYGIRLHIPHEIGKAILLPRRVLERALVDPGALRTVRNIIRSAVDILRSQRAITDGHLAWHATGAVSWSGPRCTRCEAPLFADDVVVVQGNARSHMSCPPIW
jgi:hypothetical protein